MRGSSRCLKTAEHLAEWDGLQGSQQNGTRNCRPIHLDGDVLEFTAPSR